jgi:hypothetical protein
MTSDERRVMRGAHYSAALLNDLSCRQGASVMIAPDQRTRH